MAGKPKEDLSEKQWKAIKLFEAGSSRKEIAAAIGVSDDYLQSLILGDIHKAGQVADLFKKEWQKIDSKRDEHIKALIKENTEIVQEQINRVAKELKTKKSLTHPEKRLLAAYNNTLTVNKQSVKINNLSYNYVSGLTQEELLHEFTRLTSIAEAAFNRRNVQASGKTGSGSVHPSDEQGSGLDQD
jgi:hypothetical protein